MSESEHNIAFESLGAYALGALPDAERDMVSAHLRACPICADEAAALSRTATRLIDTVPSLEPSPAVRDRIMAVVESEAQLLRAASRPAEPVRAERRGFVEWLSPGSMRWVATGAALLAVGAVLGAVLPRGGGSPTRTIEADVGRGHAWVETKDGRSDLVVSALPAPAKGKVYEVWVKHGTDPAQPASSTLADATFVVRSGKVDIPAHLGSGDRVMVTAEPVGGSLQPTSIPVVITSPA